MDTKSLLVKCDRKNGNYLHNPKTRIRMDFVISVILLNLKG